MESGGQRGGIGIVDWGREKTEADPNFLAFVGSFLENMVK